MRFPPRPEFLTKPANILLVVLLTVIVISGLIWLRQSDRQPRQGNDSFSLVSSAFKDGQAIPSQFTCDGENVSPPLQIKNVPDSVKFLAIVVEDLDLDAKTIRDNQWSSHWLVWNIPAKTLEVLSGVRPDGTVGRNIEGNFRYAGPCPPSGETHHYRFSVFGLKDQLNGLTADASLIKVKKEIDAHTIAKSAIILIYTRLKK